jgi:hypothetical protein
MAELRSGVHEDRRQGECFMKRVISLFAAVTVAVIVSASVAEAQIPIRFGIAGGASVPVGNAGDNLETGFHGQVMLGFGVIALPVRLRADLTYHNFTGKQVFFSGADERVISGALNANISMGGIGVNPYVSGGLGVYNTKVENRDGQTDFGINGGFGLEIGLTGMSAFIEARYVNVFTEGESTAFIPITFGILF